MTTSGVRIPLKGERARSFENAGEAQANVRVNKPTGNDTNECGEYISAERHTQKRGNQIDEKEGKEGNSAVAPKGS